MCELDLEDKYEIMEKCDELYEIICGEADAKNNAEFVGTIIINSGLAKKLITLEYFTRNQLNKFEQGCYLLYGKKYPVYYFEI